MTREEFDEFMDGEQWTPAQRDRFERMTPVGTPEVVRNEMKRADGIVEVKRWQIPTGAIFRTIVHKVWPRGL
jgi:hypothetical protein